MLNTPIVAANWKMHKTPQEGYAFVNKIRNMLLDIHKAKVIFCPPFTALFHMNAILEETPHALGAQNVHWEPKGAYTGEIAVEMLQACGVTYVIVGHSERRHVFQEPDDWINAKVAAVLKGDLTPILCVGETLQERERDNTEKVLERQLREGLKGLPPDSLAKIIIAYEPVWAIGTGVNANCDQVKQAHETIRNLLRMQDSETEASTVPILYGGSVNVRNAQELIETWGVDGFLIGGASLEVSSLARIVHIVENNYTRKAW